MLGLAQDLSNLLYTHTHSHTPGTHKHSTNTHTLWPVTLQSFSVSLTPYLTPPPPLACLLGNPGCSDSERSDRRPQGIGQPQGDGGGLGGRLFGRGLWECSVKEGCYGDAEAVGGDWWVPGEAESGVFYSVPDAAGHTHT